MRRLFLSHVLGAWLLLSQLPRELSGQKPDDVIKACGRELARLRIEICGSLSWKKTVLRLEEPGLEAGQPVGKSSRPRPLRTSHWMLSECRPSRTARLRPSLAARAQPRVLLVPSTAFCAELAFLVRVSPGSSAEGGKAAGTANGRTRKALGALHLLAPRVKGWGEGGSHRRGKAAQRSAGGGAPSALTPESRSVGRITGVLAVGATAQDIST